MKNPVAYIIRNSKQFEFLNIIQGYNATNKLKKIYLVDIEKVTAKKIKVIISHPPVALHETLKHYSH